MWAQKTDRSFTALKQCRLPFYDNLLPALLQVATCCDSLHKKPQHFAVEQIMSTNASKLLFKHVSRHNFHNFASPQTYIFETIVTWKRHAEEVKVGLHELTAVMYHVLYVLCFLCFGQQPIQQRRYRTW